LKFWNSTFNIKNVNGYIITLCIYLEGIFQRYSFNSLKKNPHKYQMNNKFSKYNKQKHLFLYLNDFYFSSNFNAVFCKIIIFVCHKNLFCYFIVKRGLKGSQIPKFIIFGCFFSFQFWCGLFLCELIVLRTSIKMTILPPKKLPYNWNKNKKKFRF
jgi:hypothetical protein